MHYPPGMASVLSRKNPELSIEITHPTPRVNISDEVPTIVPSNDNQKRDAPTILPYISTMTQDNGMTKSFYS